MKRNKSFILRNIYGKFLLMPTTRNEVGDEPIYFNSVAAKIWELSTDQNNKNDIIDQLTQLYNLEYNSAETAAIEQFIDILIEKKLIFE